LRSPFTMHTKGKAGLAGWARWAMAHPIIPALNILTEHQLAYIPVCL